MKSEKLSEERIRALRTEEADAIIGGSGIIEHLKCLAEAYANSPVKTCLLGGTIWGLARNIGIIAGCSGA